MHSISQEGNQLKSNQSWIEKMTLNVFGFFLMAIALLIPTMFASATTIGTNIAVTGTFTVAGVSTISDDFDPDANGTINLGSYGYAWNDIFASGTIYATTLAGNIHSRGIEWTSRTSSDDHEWRSVTYGNGLFVAVSKTSSGDQAMTSPDGINWTTRTTPGSNDWRYVTYGNGMFVAVAADGTGDQSMYSPDGINWKSGNTPSVSQFWRSVAYGDGKFVATAITGTATSRVMTSSDGINWTLQTTPDVNNQWAGVAYGNGLFVAVAADGTGDQVITSPDGITWTARDGAADSDWFGIGYGNGLFVATGTDTIMTSPDGITWTSRTAPSDSSHQWHSVAYHDGLFVSVAKTGTGNRVMTSPDGITWTTRSNPVDNAWHAVTYGNGMFVATANEGTGNRVMTSGHAEVSTIDSNNIHQGTTKFTSDVFVSGTMYMSTSTIINTAGTSTVFAGSSASGYGGRLILENSDGTGCVSLWFDVNLGLSSSTVTCPTQ